MFRVNFLATLVMLGLASALAMAQPADHEPFMPVYKLGSVAWTSEATEVQIVPGRVTGPVVVFTPNTGRRYVLLDPQSGEELSSFVTALQTGRTGHRNIVSPDGQWLAESHFGWGSNVYQTTNGNRIDSLKRTLYILAYSANLNRIVHYTLLSSNSGQMELRTSPGNELVSQIGDGEEFSFDEPSSRLYGNSGGRVSEYDAVTGALLGQYNMGFAGPVARLPGTDTLIVVGWDHRNMPPYDYHNSPLRVVVLDMKSNTGRILRSELSPDWNLFRANSARITPSVTGDTLFFYDIKSDVGRYRTSHVFAYAKGKGLYLHASGMFDTLQLGAGNGLTIYLPDLNRFGTNRISFTNGVLRVWDLVPVGTTSVTGAEGSVDVRLMIDGDHLRVVGSPAATLVGLYDATGRTYALRCMGSPCQTANVAALASGSYLARIDTGVQVVTVTFTIVR